MCPLFWNAWCWEEWRTCCNSLEAAIKPAMQDMQIDDISCVYPLKPPATVQWTPPSWSRWNSETCLHENEHGYRACCWINQYTAHNLETSKICCFRGSLSLMKWSWAPPGFPVVRTTQTANSIKLTSCMKGRERLGGVMQLDIHIWYYKLCNLQVKRNVSSQENSKYSGGRLDVTLTLATVICPNFHSPGEPQVGLYFFAQSAIVIFTCWQLPGWCWRELSCWLLTVFTFFELHGVHKQKLFC